MGAVAFLAIETLPIGLPGICGGKKKRPFVGALRRKTGLLRAVLLIVSSCRMITDHLGLENFDLGPFGGLQDDLVDRPA